MALIILPLLSSGQYQAGFCTEMFFARVPSAATESLGRASVAIDDDIGNSYYNPAGISRIEQIELRYSYVGNYYFTPDGTNYQFMALGYRMNKYLQVALTRFQWTLKGDILGTERSPVTAKNTISMASEPFRNILFGMSLNYLTMDFGIGEIGSSVYLDAGVIKKFEIYLGTKFEHTASIGASVVNLNSGAVTGHVFPTAELEEDLPVVGRVGISYDFQLEAHKLFDSLTTLGLTITSEYQDVLNHDYRTALRFGLEVEMFELLALRSGYYHETVYDYGFPSVNYGKISDLTIGFGINVPIHYWTKVPIRFSFDYTSLPQVSYSTSYTESELQNFTNYTFTLAWVPN